MSDGCAGSGPAISIVTLADRPDLVRTVAGWLWHEFWRNDGYGLAATTAAVARATSREGLPQTFVLLAEGAPVGTASLAAEDLDERPFLSPWLAGVFVMPQQRGRGHASRLIGAVEAACQVAAIPEAWLYTNTAQTLYARAGWKTVEIVERRARPAVMLMLKKFGA